MLVEITDCFDIQDEYLMDFLKEQGFYKKSLTIKQAKEKIKKLILDGQITIDDLSNSDFVGVADDYEYNFD